LIICCSIISFFFSCQKETTPLNDLPESDLQLLEKLDHSNHESYEALLQSEFKKKIVIVRCTTKRKRYNCKSGRGLCNCEWFPGARTNENGSKIEVLIEEENDVAYLFNETFYSEDSEKFYIDEDISLSIKLNGKLKNISFLEGEYDFSEYYGKPAVSVPITIF